MLLIFKTINFFFFKGHPYYFVNLLNQERNNYDDGLFQRFLMLAPSPPFITAKQMREAPTTEISIHCIFYFIHVLHYQQKRNYIFSNEAAIIIDTELDINKHRVRESMISILSLGTI